MVRLAYIWPVLGLASACFVDLERISGELRLTIANPSPAVAVRLEILGSSESEGYAETFSIEPAQSRVELPSLSVLAGVIQARVILLDRNGEALGGARTAEIGIDPDRVTRWTFDFAASAENMGASTEESLSVSLQPSAWGLSETIQTTRFIVPSSALESLLSTLRRHLVGQPATLAATAFTLTVVDLDLNDDPTDPLTLDELWNGDVEVRARGGGVDVSLGSFTASESVSVELSSFVVALDEWLTDSANPEFVLTGTADDGSQPGFELRLTVLFRATR